MAVAVDVLGRLQIPGMNGSATAESSVDVAESVDDDCSLFLKICEENLSVKPVIVRDRCRRLGKPSGDKPRPFLVVFHNEQAVADILYVARVLRISDNEYVKHNVYLNRDLT